MKEGSLESLFVNGELAVSVDGKELMTAGIDENGGNLGRGYFSGVFTYFRGEMQEILVYTRALSEAERADLETYLKAKYWSKSQRRWPSPAPRTTPRSRFPAA